MSFRKIIFLRFLVFMLLNFLLTPALFANAGTVEFNEPVQITTNPGDDFAPSVAPDGSFLIYVSDRSGNLDLWKKDLGKGILPLDRKLTAHSSEDNSPAISPDGKQVVFISHRRDPKGDVYMLNLSGEITEEGEDNAVRLTNGDFSDNLNDWQVAGNVSVISEEAIFDSTVSPYVSSISQIIYICDKDSILSFSIKPTAYDKGPSSVGINIYKNDVLIGSAWYIYDKLTPNIWKNISFKLSRLWFDYHGTSMPDFDKVLIYAEATYGDIVVFDNFSLKGLPCPEPPQEEPAGVRTHPMTVWQIFINEDNDFQFIFWYLYSDNNLVKIYDMAENLVFEVDLPNPNLIVDLPDGMYTVKTFHGSVPLQEFIIGKP